MCMLSLGALMDPRTTQHNTSRTMIITQMGNDNLEPEVDKFQSYYISRVSYFKQLFEARII